MPESRSFSAGVDDLLEKLRPHGRRESCVPDKLDDGTSRRKAGEELRSWFIRMVDTFCDGDTGPVKLEDNIAVFARLRWRDRKGLEYANIQTVVADCDLDTYYLTAEGEAMYLRMDFDYGSLGDPFSHPLAHIHVDGDLSPRFALDGGGSGNIVLDYLEFLYRHYHPNKWIRWVEREWAAEFAASAKADDVDPLPVIREAFASSQFDILRTYEHHLSRIKRLLRRRKDAIFDLHMDGADRTILEYPLTR